MIRRMEGEDLKAEFRTPAMRAMLLAYLNMMVGRIKGIQEFRDRGVESMTYLDLVIVVYCFIWADEGGARELHICNTLDLPRRTVRTRLSKLVARGALVRDDSAYYPTAVSAGAANVIFSNWTSELRTLCDAFERLNNARG